MQTGIAIFSQTTGHPFPYNEWVKKMDSKDYKHENFWIIRHALELKDSSKIFKSLQELESKGASAGLQFQIRLALLKGYSLYDISYKNNIQKIDSILKIALYQAYEIEDDYLAAEVSRLLGLAHLFNGDPEEGILYCINTTDIQDKIGHEQFPNVSLTRRLLGEFLYDRFQYEESKYYLKQAISFDLVEWAGKRQEINLLNTIGLCWEKLDKYDSAITTFQQATKLAVRLKDTLWLGIISGSMGDMLVRQNKLSEAEPLLRYYYSISIKYAEWANAANALQFLSVITLANGNTDSAIIKLRDAVVHLQKLPQPFYLRSIYKNINFAWEQKRNADSAYHYYKLYTHLNDSLENSIQSSNIKLARIKSVHERNIYKIDVLQKEKRVEIVSRNFLVVSIVLLSIAGILYVNRQRLQLKWKEQQAQQQKTIADAEIKTAREQLHLFTQHIVEKTTLIEKLQEQLYNNVLTNEQHQIINELSSQVILTDEDWQKFKSLFEKIYPGFFISLKEKAPDITLAEQRMAALIRLHLTTRQMASMLGISVDSVSKTRQRLRSRLKIPAEFNLAESMATL